MKVSNETKVGIIAAAAITILIVGFNFLKGESLFSKNNTYHGVYQEVDGLFRSNPVVLNGYSIGHVSSVEMDHETLNLIVSVQIPSTIKLPKNTVLKITNNDLLGSKAVEIVMGDDSLGFAANNDTLTSMKDEGMEKAITKVLSPLSKRINDVLGDIDTAISDVSLNQTLADLSDALAVFKTTGVKLNKLIDGKGEEIDVIIANLKALSADLKTSSPQMKQIISNLDTTTAAIARMDLDNMSKELTNTINELHATLEAVNEGQGTLGKLATDDELWHNLNKASHDLDSLVKDIIAYPRRYTGITDGQRKKGDKQKEVNEGIDLPTETKNKK